MTQKLLFVCLGNICRSPAAEGLVRDLCPEVETDSCGTGAWHVGRAALWSDAGRGRCTGYGSV